MIHLEEDAKDKLVWTKNPATRDLTAKLGYKNWGLEQYQGEMNDLWKQVWKNAGPLKDKIILWLALSNKLLTWENLKKRGWHGPSWCVLCHLEEETRSHMFSLYSYPEIVWKEGSKELKSQWSHVGYSLE